MHLVSFCVRRLSRRFLLASCHYEVSAVVQLQLWVVGLLHATKKHIRRSCNITIKIYESYISSCSLRVINVLRLWLAGLGAFARLTLAAVAGIMLVVSLTSRVACFYCLKLCEKILHFT